MLISLDYSELSIITNYGNYGSFSATIRATDNNSSLDPIGVLYLEHTFLIEVGFRDLSHCFTGNFVNVLLEVGQTHTMSMTGHSSLPECDPNSYSYELANGPVPDFITYSGRNVNVAPLAE